MTIKTWMKNHNPTEFWDRKHYIQKAVIIAGCVYTCLVVICVSMTNTYPFEVYMNIFTGLAFAGSLAYFRYRDYHEEKRKGNIIVGAMRV